MSDQKDVREVTKSEVKDEIPKFGRDEFDKIATMGWETFVQRRRDRSDVEKQWSEVDRQLSLKPDKSLKKLPGGKIDKNLMWLPEIELPLQATTLEILVSDTRSAYFPDSGSFFTAHAEMSDEYLAKVEADLLILGEKTEKPSLVDQENADQLVISMSNHWMSQYKFKDHIDLISGESLKYGMGIGRARSVKKSIITETSRGLVKSTKKIPMLVPRSIKNVYLDDTEHSLMHEGFSIGPMEIDFRRLKWVDLVMAAHSGEDGWMPDELEGIDPHKDGHVDIIELEGDIVVPGSTSTSIVIPGAIVTIINAKEGSADRQRVVRFRFRKLDMQSIIRFPYHDIDIDNVYSKGVLTNAAPVQKSATLIFNELNAVAALQGKPPIQWDRADPVFAQQGGPKVFPNASWGTTGEVNVQNIGDLDGLLRVYVQTLQQYSDLTGINPARLGARTVSHTTRFSKESEIVQGQSRTKDFVDSSLEGPMEQWLDLQYRMGRANMKGRETVFMSEYGGYVDISKDSLPERAIFTAEGAGQVIEDNQKEQQQLGALEKALNLEILTRQSGLPPEIDIGAIKREFLRKGGITDVDAFIVAGGANVSQGPAGSPVVQQASDPTGGAVPAAIQALSLPGS